MVGVPSVWLEYPQFGGGTLRLVWVPLVWWGCPLSGMAVKILLGKKIGAKNSQTLGPKCDMCQKLL